jgi:hypothetical protein
MCVFGTGRLFYVCVQFYGDTVSNVVSSCADGRSALIWFDSAIEIICFIVCAFRWLGMWLQTAWPKLPAF